MLTIRFPSFNFSNEFIFLLVLNLFEGFSATGVDTEALGIYLICIMGKH